MLCIKGKHEKKFACSRNLYCMFQKRDGLKAYIWVNRFHEEQESELAFHG